MSTNKSKVPLDKEYLPKPSMVVKTIDMNQKEVKQDNISTGVRLVEAVTLTDELQISEEELKMVTETKIEDITDFGEFAPTQVISDATDFPLIDGNVGILTEEPEVKKESK